VLKKLSEKEVQIRLADLDDWTYDGEAIERHWEFLDFSEAMDFINMVAVIAQEQNHHPQIVNLYNQVSLRLWTHTANGVTGKDIDMAMIIDKL